VPYPASSLARVLAYHERTKHLPGRFARALGYMDWDTQPDPFRRFTGAQVLPLDLIPLAEGPRYESVFSEGRLPAAPLDRVFVSRLLHDSLALSAWKQAAGTRWSLRVNPSSGNLHPTEAYVIAGAVPGLADAPAVYHYAPRLHALERRLSLSESTWATLTRSFPDGAVLVGLSSIHWREAWKYGERAFRYCQHDLGHAIAAIAVAAAGLGWRCRLLDGVADDHLAVLLGIHTQSGVEAEHPDVLLLLLPGPHGLPPHAQQLFSIPSEVTRELSAAAWSGAPNPLSAGHHLWPAIEEVTAASARPALPPSPPEPFALDDHSLAVGDAPIGLRQILHRRRSALDFDGHSGITREALFQILLKTMPGDGKVPFSALPFRPRIDLLLFIHRVQGLVPGLYALVRDPSRSDLLRAALDGNFVWRRPEACPDSLPLVLLEAGDARRVAVQTSCGQELAGNGVLAAAMLAEYRRTLETRGPWYYRRLHWEAGLVGQMLYLEAEASAIGSTGIGCFFDDLTHGTFGIRDDRFVVLYHFALGAPVEDSRIESGPAY
jgi:SagB-type dehydrogenase family enzyme